MPENDIQYNIVLPDGKRTVFNQEQYDEYKEKLFTKYNGAKVTSSHPYDPASDDDGSETDTYDVTAGGKRAIFSAEQFANNKEKLYAKYPDAKVNRIVDESYAYWEPRRQATKAKLDAIDSENEGFIREYQSKLRSSLSNEQTNYYEDEAQKQEIQDWVNANKAQYDTLDRQRRELLEQYYSNPNTIREYREGASRAGYLYDRYIEKADAAETGAERRDWKRAAKLQDDIRKVYEAPNKYTDGDAANGFLQYLSDYAKGAGDVFSDKDFYTRGFTEIARNFDLRGIAKKIEEASNAKGGDLSESDIDRIISPSEKAELMSFYALSEAQRERADSISSAYRAGSSFADSVGYMAEFLLSSGLGNLLGKGMSGSSRALKSWLGKQLMSDHALRRAIQKGVTTAPQYGSKAAKVLTEAAVKPLVQGIWHTGTQISSYANISEGLLQTNSNGELISFGRAIIERGIDSVIENWSESVGGVLDAGLAKAAGWLGKKTLGGTSFARAARWLYESGPAQVLFEAGFNGMLGEIAEEWVGNATRVAIDEIAEKMFGNAIGLMSKEEFKEWGGILSKDKDIRSSAWAQQAEMAASFAPMSLIGLGSSTMAAYRKSNQFKQVSGKVKGILQKQGVPDGEIERLFNTRFDTAEDIGRNVAPYLQRAAQDQNSDDYKTILQFAELAGREAVFEEFDKVEKEQERNSMQEQIAAGAGQFWYDTPDNGSQVRVVETDGKTYYILGEGVDGTYAAISSDGEHKVFSADRLAAGAQDGTLTDTQMSLDDYLQQRVDASKKTAEAERMNREANEQLAAVKAQIAAKPEVNLGTREAPVLAAVTASDNTGVMVAWNDEEGNYQEQPLTWNEVANKLQTPIVVRTDEQLENDAAAALDDARARVSQYQKITPGTEIRVDLPELGEATYRFQKAIVDEGQVIIYAEDENGESKQFTEEMVVDLPGLLAQEDAATAVNVPEEGTNVVFTDENGDPVKGVVSVKDNGSGFTSVVTPAGDTVVIETARVEQDAAPAQEPEDDGVLRDFRGNPIPMIESGEDAGEVDLDAFFDRDTEAWARWNDEQRGDGGADSRQNIEVALKSVQKTIKAAQKEHDVTASPNKRRKQEQAIATLVQRAEQLQGLIDGYVAREEAAKAEEEARRAAAESEAAAAEEVAEAPAEVAVEAAPAEEVPAPAEPVFNPDPEVAAAEAQVDLNPTDAQKEAGNYQKGHVVIDGHDITIENPKGSVRSGVDADGNPWSVTMNNTYGYIRRTEGVDGDQIDVFLSDNPTEGNVYVVDQVKPDGSFDEHKVMYGFASAEEAQAAYLANYSPGWKGLGVITEVSKDEFAKWLDSSTRKTKPFSEYKSVEASGAQNQASESVGADPLLENETQEIRDAVDAIVSGKDTKKREIAYRTPNDFTIGGKDINSYIRDRYDRFKAPLEKRREELRKELVAYISRIKDEARADIMRKNPHIKEDNPYLPDYVSEEADKRLKDDEKYNSLNSQITAIDNEIGNYQPRRYNAFAAIEEIYAQNQAQQEIAPALAEAEAEQQEIAPAEEAVVATAPAEEAAPVQPEESPAETPAAELTEAQKQVMEFAGVDQQALALAEEKRQAPLQERLAKWRSVIGDVVTVLTSIDDVMAIENKATRDEFLAAKAAGETVHGFYDPTTKKAYLFLPDIRNTRELDRKVLHEVISHKGLAGVMGEEGFNAFLDRVWNDMMDADSRKEFLGYVNGSEDSVASRRHAADEYVAHVAEHNTSIIKQLDETAWDKFVNAVKEIINDIIGDDFFDTGVWTPFDKELAQAFNQYRTESGLKFQEQVNAPTGQKSADAVSETRFSLTRESQLRNDSEAFLRKLEKKPISEKDLKVGSDAIKSMVDYMLPYLDKVKEGKRYMPEEIFGKEWSTIFTNGSYGRTMENTLICMRTLAYNDFVNTVQDKIGRPLTPTESFLASQMLYDIATDPQCLYCYVALDRKAYNGFLKIYIEQRDAVLDKYKADESIDRTYRLPEQEKDKKKRKKLAGNNPVAKLYLEYLQGRADTPSMRERFNAWLDHIAEGSLIKMSDVTSPSKRQKVALRGESYAKQIADAENYAQAASWAKKQEEYRAYNGELLTMPQTTVDLLNKEYGLRFYSFSEYSPAFIVENMQMVRDAALRSLVGLAYTKEIDFAKIFAPTGININISTYGREAEDGTVVMDTKQGADWQEAQALREQYGNVGVVFVAVNDKMVEWAIDQPWIDVVIPFHIVRTGADIASFYDWTNYSSMQADKGKKGRSTYLVPTEHKNDKDTFLSLCEKRGLKPRFADLIIPSTGKSVVEHPNYMKLVNETRRSVKETVRLKPVFNLDEARRSFSEFVEKGGYYGGWFVDDEAFEKGVEQVSGDVLAGKTAKDVDYGRQDIKMSADKLAEIAMKRSRPRSHQKAPLTKAQRNVLNFINGRTESEGNTRFSKTNQTENGFISNAQAALGQIAMEKATPQQWIKMLTDKGGMKAGEDKWLGLSDWLKNQDRKTVTKQEISDFIDQNHIQIEEEKYGVIENSEAFQKYDSEYRMFVESAPERAQAIEDELTAFWDEMRDKYGEDFEYSMTGGESTNEGNLIDARDMWRDDPKQAAYEEMVDKYGDDFRLAFDYLDVFGEGLTVEDKDAAAFFLDIKPIDSTRLGYTTDGLENKREIAMTVPTIDSWNVGDVIHFGDAGEGRAVAWVRFGDAKQNSGFKEAKKRFDEAADAFGKYRDMIISKYALRATDTNNTIDLATPEETAKARELHREMLDRHQEMMHGQHRIEKVLFIDEIQSKRHQEAREQGGYMDDSALKAAEKKMAEAYDAYYGYWGKLIEKYGENNVRDKITPEEDAENQRLYSDYRHAESVVSRGGFDPMENEEYRSIIIEMNENSKAMKPFHEGWRESHDENVKLVQKAEESGISEEQSQEYYNKAYEASERMMEFGEKLKPYQEKYRELQDRLDKLYLELYQAFNSSHKSSKIPAAPFEKNWHELAMKRMLRLAAEEGYDYVAWTTGEQQADRYSLSQHVSEIAVKAVGDNKYRVVIEDSYGSELEDYRGSGKEMDAKGLSELVGKELATRLITGAEQSKGKEWSGKGKNPEYFTIKGDDLRIGGEGMKGFYDGILVNFMNKYGKKWGIQVEDINLPDLEESARTAHAVRVTPEMKESVLQGQLMFSRVTPEQDKEYLDAVKSGDMAKAQELVNKAAKAAGYTIKAFHGTGAKEGEITVFDDQKDKWSEAPDGTFWFASNKLSADTYNYNTPDDLEETGNTSNGLGLGSTIPVYLKMENPMTYNAEGANWDDIPWGDDYTTSNDMARTARWQGYDGLILKNITDIGWAEHEGKTLDDYLTDDYAVFSPNQIKSAEPVTYDDAGNVIPLSERFNESNPDIRFSKAYHGTGADFDAFDHSHMSEGEGNQAYGWGTYVAFNREVGLAYARQIGGDTSRNEELIRQWNDELKDPNIGEERRGELEKAIEERQREIDAVNGKRNLYTVEIPEDDGYNYLHWDEPITAEQSRRIMDLVRENVEDKDAWGDMFEYELKSTLGYGTFGRHVLGGMDYFLGNLYNYETDEDPGAERNSKLLRSIGIVGMVHPAHGVNGEELEDEPNVVIYDENDLTIVEHLRFSKVTDKAEIDRLEKEPYTTLYRAMEKVEEGEYIPVMSQKIPNAKGERGKKLERRNPEQKGFWYRADEDPGKAYQKKDGGAYYYDLKKSDPDQRDVNGVLYNPYLHLSAFPLNDQFKAASERPNIVIVKFRVPLSEAEGTSGYRAEKANDAVGPKPWKAGPVMSYLPGGRTVVLSRWAKNEGEVSDDEVADMVARKIIDAGLAVPETNVTPSMKTALEKKGVKFVKTEAEAVEWNKKAAEKEREPEVNNTTLFSRVTPEQDKEYLDAVNAGDMDKAWKMVRAAFKAAFPNTKVVDENGEPLVVYHGTQHSDKKADFNVFNLDRISTGRTFGDGFYFTNSKELGENYAKRYIARGRAGVDDYENLTPRLIPAFLNIENIIDVSVEGLNRYRDLFYEISVKESDYRHKGIYPDGKVVRGIKDGYDIKSDVYVVESASQIKSADPVTYDDAGNVIPLSERFNPSNPDIRFSKESAGDILDRYENQDGSEEYPWMSESEMIDRIESELPYGINTEEIFSLIDKYRRLDAEDFDEGRRDFSGSERDEVFNDIVDALREYSKGDVRFSKANESQRIFISNAAAAAEAVPMDKATPEQWIKMLSDRGGMKAGEDKWIGLSDWLKNQDRKTITKQEVLDFINQNQIQIEETNYSEDAEYYYAEAIRSYQDEFDELVEEATRTAEANNYDSKYEYAYEKMAERYGDDFYEAFDRFGDTIAPTESWDQSGLSGDAEIFLRKRFNKNTIRGINSARIGYTTDGLENKREIALTVPTIEPWNENDEVHFGDAGNGRAIAWIRFGDAKGYSGLDQQRVNDYEHTKKEYGMDWARAKTQLDRGVTGRTKNQAELDLIAAEMKLEKLDRDFADVAGKVSKVLFIDEIQSKRHQEAREQGGYKNPELQAKAERRGELSWKFYSEEGVSLEEKKEYDALQQELYEIGEKEVVDNAGRPSAAPFEKNWHELAMKRMLRLAAEEGYDYVAWTTGNQQAERYSLSEVVSRVNIEKDGRRDDLYEVGVFGKNGESLDSVSGMYDAKRLGETFGKELAAKMVKDAEEAKGEVVTLEEDNLKIGGEGMKGFYDDILVRFMNKYGKKWSILVEDINLPGLEESARTAHAVRVTPEMKESVLQGQLMFSKEGGEKRARTPLETAYDVDRGGIKAVVGEENVSDFYNGLYRAMPEQLRAGIVSRAEDAGWNFHEALKGRLAELALAGNDDSGLLRLAERMLSDYYGHPIDEATARYILWRTAQPNDSLTDIQKTALKRRWKVGEKDTDVRFSRAQFKAAFPDTKVVDENGEPLVVYKRQQVRHNVLDTSSWGSFFSSEPIEDKSFGFDVSAYFLNMKNPLVVDAMGNNWSHPLWLDLTDKNGELIPPEQLDERIGNGLYGLPKEVWEHIYNDSEEYEFDQIGVIIRRLNLPYDGVIINNIYEGSDSEQKVTDYIILSPSQAKLSDDTTYDDNGNPIPSSERFNENNPDIRFSKGDLGRRLEETSQVVGIIADGAKESLDQQKKALKGELRTVSRAMSAQKVYDRSTVDTITGLAKQVLKDQEIETMSRREIARLMGLIRTSVGKAPRTVKHNADILLDIIIDNLLRTEENRLAAIVRTGASRTNASGVEVQGKLDVRGQNVLKAYRAGLDMTVGKPDDDETEGTVYARLAVLQERLDSEDDAVRAEAEAEYDGLTMALEYHENIKASRNEERSLRDDMAEAAEEARRGGMSRAAYNEYVEDTQSALRENRVDRIESFRELRIKLAELIEGSKTNAAAFRQRERDRINAIHHLANSDMQGRTADQDKRPGRLGNFLNSSLVRFFTSPLATFDQMLRAFGSKSVNGQGYLWNKYMREWIEARENEIKGTMEAKQALDRKASEVFGKEMIWSDIYDIVRKMPKAKVKWWSGGAMQDHELTQGQLLYIYMVNKMADGRMKLRRMGISEEDVRAIRNQMDERFITLADWLQDEFLVGLRNKYNAVHERLFGASMAAIEDYFPLVINKRSLNQQEDIAAEDNGDTLPATTTGSIIKRRRNSRNLDLLNADAFDVVIRHIEQMERWAAFAEYNRDLNTLLSYNRFRNQVKNMETIYGTGDVLWKNFRNVSRIAGNTYRPTVKSESLDSAAVNLAKGVTAAKINFRVYTAMKQFLSMPAFFADANIGKLAGAIAHQQQSWKWAMENLPLFESRWKSRIAGDTRLMNTDSDWKLFRSRAYDKLSKMGMSPNAFVDALTVSIGAKALYDTKYERYIADGYTEEQAAKKAKQDATILYNETQQSSEGAFVSTVQLDRTLLSTMISVFRNSSMGFQRQLHDALRNLARRTRSGYREESLEFMTKQGVRDGLTEEQAAAAAEREYNRGMWHDMARVATFGMLVQFAWNLGASLAYLLFGDDDDKKEEMVREAFIHSLFGSIEGLSGGNIMSEALNMVAKGESLRNYDPSLLPIISDMKRIYSMAGYDKVAAFNSLVNLAVQAGIGANPETISDAVVAVVDASKGDLGVANEAMLLILRVLQVPQSQLDEIYIDELGMNARSARRLNYRQMADRYAKYKIAREAGAMSGFYSDEKRKAREESRKKTFQKKVNERKKLNK